MYKALRLAVPNGKYQGCFSVHKSEVRLFIKEGDHPHPTKDKWCSLSTNDPFWKRVNDIDFKTQTRAKKEKK